MAEKQNKSHDSVKKSKNIAQKVAELVKGTVEECGCTLWDVELVKEGADLSLVISIDKEGGISLDDCQMVNDAVEPIIDKADPIEEGYFLEISSAGLERELSKPEHIRAYIGSNVSIKLYAPLEKVAENGEKIKDTKKQFDGLLSEFDEDNKIVTIIENDVPVVIELSKIALMKNIVEY